MIFHGVDELRVYVVKREGEVQMILRCVCVHKIQDRLHGDGMRVANILKHEQGKPWEARCTVCGRVSTVTAEEAGKT